MSEIVRRPEADRDLIAFYRYYAREAGLATADRFFAQAEATILSLAKTPGIGARYESDFVNHTGLRYFPISRFRSLLVFYAELPDGIEVLRVLHGARDLEGLLSEQFGGDPDVADPAE